MGASKGPMMREGEKEFLDPGLDPRMFCFLGWGSEIQ
jgi:hypothetical protein